MALIKLKEDKFKVSNFSSKLFTFSHFTIAAFDTKKDFSPEKDSMLQACSRYGDLYTAREVNEDGSKGDLQIVKLFWNSQKKELNKIRNIQNHLSAYQHKEDINYKPIKKVEALRFLPIVAFKDAVFYDVKVSGYSFNPVDENWFCFEQILNVEKLRKEFYEIPLKKRIDIAKSLVEGYLFIHSNDSNILFADFSPKNILINKSTKEIALYNYENIQIVGESIDINDLCWNDWRSPELSQLVDKNILPKIEMALWSLCMAIHTILFSVSPFFYLIKKNKKDLERYLQNYKWPDIDRTTTLFFKRDIHKYLDYINDMVKVPEELFRAFSNTFNDGYIQAGSRTSISQWYDMFFSNRELSVLFTVDKDVVVRGMPVKLKWFIKGDYKIVIIDKLGDVTEMSEIEVLPDRDVIYKITVIGKYNEVKESLTVLVIPLPVIEEIKIPFPEFEFETNLQVLFDRKLDIEVKLPEFQINNLIVNAGLPDIEFAPTPRFTIEAPKLDFNINLDFGIKGDQALMNNAITEDLARLEIPKANRIFSRIYKALKKKKNGYSQ